MSALNLDVLNTTPIQHKPFDYMVVSNFLSDTYIDAINLEFPTLDGPGSFSLESIKCSTALKKLADELRGPAITEAMS